MGDGREQRLLLTAARLFLGTGHDEEALALLRLPVDWGALYDQAAQEGMLGLVAVQLRRLARAHNLDLPLDPFTRALHGTFTRNGAILAELTVLRQALQQQGLQAILLKGGVLIETVYRSHPGVRPLTDLDLLVKGSDLPAFQELLFDRGNYPVSDSPTSLANRSVAIDLHTELINAERISRNALAFKFDDSVIWREASSITPDDPTLLILSRVDQVLHLALHALKHSFSRLIWFVDMRLVLQGVDWEDLLARAKATGTLRPLAYALFALERLMGLEFPSHLRDRLPRFNGIERAFLRGVINRQPLGMIGELTIAFSIPNLSGKLAYLAEFAFPRPDVLAGIFPSTPSWLLYPRRLLQAVHLGLQEARNILGLAAHGMRKT